MLKLKLVLFSVLPLIVSCGTFQPTEVGEIHPEFKTYVEKFQAESGIQTLNIKMSFINDFDDEVVGSCRYSKPIRKIIISQIFWKNASLASREQLIYHELGHCVLNKPHDDSLTIINGEYIPNSVMNSYMISDYFYVKYRDHYINNLFETE